MAFSKKGEVQKGSIHSDNFLLNNQKNSKSKLLILAYQMRTNLTRAVVICILTSAVISSSAIAKVTGGHSADAKIYVLRRLSYTGSGRIAVSDNGKPVGTIDRGGILSWNRPAGTAVVAASHGTENKVTLTVEANQVYYIEVKATHKTAERPKVVELQVLSSKDGKHLLEILRHEFGG